MTYRNLLNYAFVNRIETFISQYDPSKIQRLSVSKHSYFHGNIVIHISSLRICSACNRTQLETWLFLPKLLLEYHVCERPTEN